MKGDDFLQSLSSFGLNGILVSSQRDIDAALPSRLDYILLARPTTANLDKSPATEKGVLIFDNEGAVRRYLQSEGKDYFGALNGHLAMIQKLSDLEVGILSPPPEKIYEG